MDIVLIAKALSNETRLHILTWLKEPEKYFPPQEMYIPEGESFDWGVCVGSITEKAGISQSTISSYLEMMRRAGLLESGRYGKWTYYRRKEDFIQQLGDYIKQELWWQGIGPAYLLFLTYLQFAKYSRIYNGISWTYYSTRNRCR